jgi:hypothetical protein
MSYRLILNSPLIERLSDGALIPPDPGNRAYQEYLRWAASGNIPLAAPTPEPSTDPNFSLFLNLILASSLYQDVVLQSTSNPVVNTGLTVTMGALLLAAGGNPNLDGLQAGINLLFMGLNTSLENLVELERILSQSNLTDLVTIPNVK